jgi:acyl-coenzyme A thioesterase PaaI-like protein
MKVVNKQHNSDTCFVCGLKNKTGLQARFYETDANIIVSIIQGKTDRNSYKGRMHGGIISAIIDETIGRAVQIIEPDTFGVTTSLVVDYKKPVPLDTDLICIGRILENNRFVFEGEGKIMNFAGVTLASGKAKYFKLPTEKIAGHPLSHEEWFIEKGDLIDIKAIEHLINFS